MKTITKNQDPHSDENQQDKKTSGTENPKQPNPDPTKTPEKPWKNPDPTTPEEGNKIYADKTTKGGEHPTKEGHSKIISEGGPDDSRENKNTEENRKQDPDTAIETKHNEPHR